MQRTMRCLAWSAAFMIGLLPMRAFTQPLADRIPADAVVYVGWTGSDYVDPSWAGNYLRAHLDATQIDRMVSEVAPLFGEAVGPGDDREVNRRHVVAEALKVLWRHPSVVYVGPFDLTHRARPRPRLAILCDAGQDADSLHEQLQSLVALYSFDGDAKLQAVVRDVGSLTGLFIGCESDIVIAENAREKSLAEVKGFSAAMSVQKSPALVISADMKAVTGLVDNTVAADAARQSWAASRETLGLASLKRVSFVLGHSGKGWSDAILFESPNPKNGVLAGLDVTPIKGDVFRLVLPDAAEADVVHFNVARLAGSFRERVQQLDAKAGPVIDKTTERFGDALGIKRRPEMLAAISRQWPYFASVNNLLRIGIGVQMYANENKQQLPDDFIGAIHTADLTMDLFINPRIERPDRPKMLKGNAFTGWARKSSDYVYIGNGKNMGDAPETVIAYEKPDGFSDGVNVLFLNGRIGFIKMPDLEKIKPVDAEPNGDGL